MQLNLIDCRHYLAGWIVEELFKVTDLKIRYTDILDFPGTQQLLHLLP